MPSLWKEKDNASAVPCCSWDAPAAAAAAAAATTAAPAVQQIRSHSISSIREVGVYDAETSILLDRRWCTTRQRSELKTKFETMF